MAAAQVFPRRKPAALDFLIRSAILPSQPSAEDYTCTTYIFDDIEHEIVTTSRCVVWSRNGVVRRLYDFSHERQNINQALLTRFPLSEQERDTRKFDTSDLHRQTSLPNSPALVILLTNLTGVYYLEGPSVLVPLSFEVERAFPFPYGVILTRKAAALNAVPPTPAVPQVPANSFRSSQVPRWSSSATPAVSRLSSAPGLAGPLGSLNKPASLLDFMVDPVIDDNSASPRYYVLTDPLSEIDVALETISLEGPTISSGLQLDMIDPEEQMVHISPPPRNVHLTGSRYVTLAITFHRLRCQYSIWQVNSIDLDAINDSQEKSRHHQPSKSRRRSSFNPRMSTGSATPLARPRDSLVDPVSSFVAAQSATRRSTRLSDSFAIENAEEASFFRTFEPELGGIGPSREPNRRTSSIVARSELSSQQPTVVPPNNSFVGSRGLSQSFGHYRDRTSFGKGRLSGRASTPGSTSFLSDVDEVSSQTVSALPLTKHLAGAAVMKPANADPIKAVLERQRRIIFTRVASLPTNTSGGFQPDKLLSPDLDVKIFEIGDNIDTAMSHVSSAWRHFLISFPSVETVFAVSVPVHREMMPVSTSTIEVHYAMPSLKTARIADVVDASKLFDRNREYCVLLQKHLNKTSLVITSDPHCSSDSFMALDFGAQLLPNRFQSSEKLSDATIKFFTGFPNLQDFRFVMNETFGGIALSKQGSQQCYEVEVATSTRQPIIQKALEMCGLVIDMLVGTSGFLSSIWLALSSSSYSQIADEDGWERFFTSIFALVTGPESIRLISALAPTRMDSPEDLSLSRSWQWVRDRRKRIKQPLGSTSFVHNCIHRARHHLEKGLKGRPQGSRPKDSRQSQLSAPDRYAAAVGVMSTLQYMREEEKLNVLTDQDTLSKLAIGAAQLGNWLGMSVWSSEADQFLAVDQDDLTGVDFDKAIRFTVSTKAVDIAPPCFTSWLEQAILQPNANREFPTLTETIRLLLGKTAAMQQIKFRTNALDGFEPRHFPRMSGLKLIAREISVDRSRATAHVELLMQQGFDESVLETLPESIACLLRHPIETCSMAPKTTWSARLLDLVGREDLRILLTDQSSSFKDILDMESGEASTGALEDRASTKGGESPDQSPLMRVLFRDDKRWEEAARLLNPLRVAVAEILPQPQVAEAQFLEEQKNFAQLVYRRTMSLPAGQAIMVLDSHRPLLTEKLTIHSFNTSVNMQPSNNTINVDRSNFTEEKVAWAFFHAGANAGLRLASDTSGIDTSWFALNKPEELGNRHAGLLLTLGLRGHLKNMAKWLAFKYLTPKHTMTSISLLLGLSASYMGSMDAWVTRVLSVHVTRLLPPGAAELNLTPSMQAAGMMGIGLLYFNTQHRRMSEVLLSEVEHVEQDEQAGSAETYRDESYRLAAGCALGLVNLGTGAKMHSLHDLGVTERLFAVATGPRDSTAVHLLDQAVAGAVLALALIYLKTGDQAVAKKLDIPSSEQQFDYIRPDILLLRIVARHLILWHSVEANFDWMQRNTPVSWRRATAQATMKLAVTSKPLSSSKSPFYNVIAGLCWSIGLRYAGSGNQEARNLLLYYFDEFQQICERHPAHLHTPYDASLARHTVVRVVNLLALALSTVMAGTGDLEVLRRLRALHATVEVNQTFGHHLAVHMAIGTLFMGGGRYTFGTSNLAIAALLCAFYPLFPNDVLDNQAHLQALRHFWIFAAQPRCLIPRDVETGQPIVTPITIIGENGDEEMRIAPCLVPEIETIRSIHTTSNEYWHVVLDFANNKEHLAAFRRHQTLWMRRKSLLAIASTTFEYNLALVGAHWWENESPDVARAFHFSEWITNLHSVASSGLSKAQIFAALRLFFKQDQRVGRLSERESPNAALSKRTDPNLTNLDDALTLQNTLVEFSYSDLLNLRMLFGWAASERRAGRPTRWLPPDYLDRLRARILMLTAVENAASRQ